MLGFALRLAAGAVGQAATLRLGSMVSGKIAARLGSRALRGQGQDYGLSKIFRKNRGLRLEGRLTDLKK